FFAVVDHNAIDVLPRISEAEVGDYLALLKPRVMSLVIFTALVGLFLAPGHVHPIIAFTSILCIAVGAGASGALNMAYEGDIDAKMTRTANRPIPRGRITPSEATAFGMTLAFFSVRTLGILVNWVAGALLAFTIFFYAVLYTIVLVAITFAPWPLGYFDAVYGVTSLVLGDGMMWLAINVYRRREGAAATRATR